MAGKYLRHARSKSDAWGGQPSRFAEVTAEVAAQVAADPSDRRPPGRKNTRRYCKGKTGVEHEPDLVPIGHCRWVTGWRMDGTASWECAHREICGRCGKVLREPWQLTRAECPVYPGGSEQRAAAEAEAVAAEERCTAWRARRVPVITGPQGYRRQRAEG